MEELQRQLEDLKRQVGDLQRQISDLRDLTYRQSLRLRNALQGSRVYYVSSANGGSLTTQLTFKDGILTLGSSPSLSPSVSPSPSPSISPSKSPSVSPS